MRSDIISLNNYCDVPLEHCIIKKHHNNKKAHGTKIIAMKIAQLLPMLSSSKEQKYPLSTIKANVFIHTCIIIQYQTKERPSDKTLHKGTGSDINIS